MHKKPTVSCAIVLNYLTGYTCAMIETVRGYLADTTFVWRSICASLVVAAFGGAWDIWWHRFVGRDTFFEPPHIMLYSGITIAVAIGFFAWRIHGTRTWRKIAFALLGIPLLVAPFDEMWHRIFGIEDLTSVWIIWSPPHVALVLAIAWALILLVPFVRRDESDARWFFGSMLFAIVLFLGAFLTIPFAPEGQFHLAGWWGPLARAGVFVAILLCGQRVLGGSFAALSIAVYYSAFVAVGAGVGVKSLDILMLPHFELPTWLFVFAVMGLALVLDALKKMNIVFLGTIAGGVWALILYGAGAYFAPVEFSYGFSESFAATVSGVIGGLCGGIVAKVVMEPREQTVYTESVPFAPRD